MPWYESPTQTHQAFAWRLRRQWLIAVPFALGLLVLSACIEALHSGSHGRIARLLIASLWLLLPCEAVLFGLARLNWRCPACKGYLGMSAFPRVCPRCGAELCRDERGTNGNPFWTLLHLSLKALRVAHEALHGFAFMIFGACLGGIAGVWLAAHIVPKAATALMIGGATCGLIAGGLIALSALRPRSASTDSCRSGSKQARHSQGHCLPPAKDRESQ
jgi:dolichol kinase